MDIDETDFMKSLIRNTDFDGYEIPINRNKVSTFKRENYSKFGEVQDINSLSKMYLDMNTPNYINEVDVDFKKERKPILFVTSIEKSNSDDVFLSDTSLNKMKQIQEPNCEMQYINDIPKYPVNAIRDIGMNELNSSDCSTKRSNTYFANPNYAVNYTTEEDPGIFEEVELHDLAEDENDYDNLNDENKSFKFDVPLEKERNYSEISSGFGSIKDEIMVHDPLYIKTNSVIVTDM